MVNPYQNLLQIAQANIQFKFGVFRGLPSFQIALQAISITVFLEYQEKLVFELLCEKIPANIWMSDPGPSLNHFLVFLYLFILIIETIFQVVYFEYHYAAIRFMLYLISWILPILQDLDYLIIVSGYSPIFKDKRTV